jgi:hypothetical protein
MLFVVAPDEGSYLLPVSFLFDYRLKPMIADSFAPFRNSTKLLH